MAIEAYPEDINKFDAKTTRYNGENALLLAVCAKLAYSLPEEIKEVVQGKWKLNHFKFFDSGKSTQAFIAGNETIIIIAFRGTQIKKLQDIITDVEFKPTQGALGNVHRGFYKALHEVWGVNALKEDMRQYLKSILNNNQSVWFCGHSLGAALAILAASEYVLNDNGKVNGIYTVGQPRVGNDEFAAGFDKALPDRCFRFINNNDIVTRVPLPLPIFKYTHVGHPLYFDSKGILLDTLSWWQKLVERFKGAVNDLGKVGPDDIKDHDSKKYIDLIAKNRSVITKWS